MNELALFAGAGGGILGGHLLGWRTVCAVEWEAYPASVLCARQNDGFLESFPIWDDVQTFDGKPWAGIVDVVSGGFPCQDISAAGKGDGLDGERSGMWKEMARIIGEVRPKYTFIENSPMLTTRGLERVLADLASMGFDAEWGVLSAADVGANHKRDRIWIVGKNTKQSRLFSHSMHNGDRRGQQQSKSFEEKDAIPNSNSFGLQEQRQFSGIKQKHNNFSNNGGSQCLANASSIGLQGQRKYEQSSNTAQSKNGQTTQLEYGRSSNFWEIEPNVGRVANGVAFGMDRLKAIGNGQVPLCAATAWELLT
jgi:DNA (cytosine-5)-methyltransferase 1